MLANGTNMTPVMFWTNEEFYFNYYIIILIVLALILHTIFWLQVIVCPTLHSSHRKS
jgi:hypothetical protein